MRIFKISKLVLNVNKNSKCVDNLLIEINMRDIIHYLERNERIAKLPIMLPLQNTTTYQINGSEAKLSIK
jgi:hypothetical protein